MSEYTVKRYDLMVPANFKYGVDKGIAYAAMIDEAISKGVRHFDPRVKEYPEMLDVQSVMDCINECATIIVWSKEMGENQLGITMFNTGEPRGVSVIMHPEIKKVLFPEKEGDVDGKNKEDTK